jgi:hypothetical protein
MGGPGMHSNKVVTGAPYTASFTDTSSQTLADGNTITHTATGTLVRDAQGRTFEQVTTNGGPMGQQGAVTRTFIFDPIAGYAYTYSSNSTVVTRRAIRTPSTSSDATQTHSQHVRKPNPNAVEADLGTKVNENGLTVTGKSVTITIPAGAVGNAAPLVSTSETWTSPDLQVVVKSTHSDPRGGTHTYTLTNIQKGVASTSVFTIPSGYTVQDAKGFGPRGNGQAPPQQ